MWEHILDSLQRRYRRREGVDDRDIQQVEKLLGQRRAREDGSAKPKRRKKNRLSPVTTSPLASRAGRRMDGMNANAGPIRQVFFFLIRSCPYPYMPQDVERSDPKRQVNSWQLQSLKESMVSWQWPPRNKAKRPCPSGNFQSPQHAEKSWGRFEIGPNSRADFESALRGHAALAGVNHAHAKPWAWHPGPESCQIGKLLFRVSLLRARLSECVAL